VKAAGFQARACARERGGKNNRIAEGQGVGGMRLGGIDVDPIVAGKGRGIEHCAIGKKGVSANMGDRGLEMQTSCDGNGKHFIVVRSEDRSKLADAFGVAAPGEADEEFAGDAENVAALESAGKPDVFQLAKARKAASGRRESVPSGRMTASSSRTMAGSSTNRESGSAGSAGSEMTRAPNLSRSFS
jgi:hypothetical protein